MAEEIGPYILDDEYRLHKVPGHEKPIELFSDSSPRLPFYGIYPATIEMLPSLQRSIYEKKILDESNLNSQSDIYWVFWFNRNYENIADIQEIVFTNRMDAQTLLELYISYNVKVVEAIIESASSKFKEITNIN